MPASNRNTSTSQPSKTQQALDWLKTHSDRTPYAAAKEFGLPPSVVYRAIKNLEATADSRCPCCGQIIRP